MRIHLSSVVTALASLVFSMGMARLAHADTYTTYSLFSGAGSVDNVGLTDSGSVTLLYNTLNPHYSTFTPPSTFVDSATAPSLTYDNGTSCAPTVAGFTNISNGVCNNGYTAFQADSPTSNQAFYVLDPGGSAQLLFAGGVSNVLLNGYGDVAFTGVLPATDTNYLAYDETSHMTPEPASWLLLTSGTGLLAFCRRRFGLA